MNKKIGCMVIIIVIFCHIISNIVKQNLVLVNNNNDAGKYSMKSIIQNNINIYYPITTYEKPNILLKNKVNKYIQIFKDKLYLLDSKEYENCFLNITFDFFSTSKYISIVLYIEENVGGLHPYSYIYTLNYSVIENEIIDINKLVNKFPYVLNIMAEYSYKNLLKDERIKKYGAYSMLELGTKATKENYKKFAIIGDYVIIYFENSTVAPYVLGQFEVKIPLKNIMSN